MFSLHQFLGSNFGIFGLAKKRRFVEAGMAFHRSFGQDRGSRPFWPLFLDMLFMISSCFRVNPHAMVAKITGKEAKQVVQKQRRRRRKNSFVGSYGEKSSAETEAA